MKETGIIMSGNSPTAILDGRKNQTRRLWGLEIINLHPDSWHAVWNEGDLWAFSNEAEQEALTLKCPYGQVGDRLWVRESWTGGVVSPLLYKAYIHPDDCYQYKWKSSLFMPRWASRILLEITKIEVERLQDIVFMDIQREGIWTWEDPWKAKGLSIPQCRMRFARLWDSLNAKRGYGWETNPWVQAITFSLTKEPGML